MLYTIDSSLLVDFASFQQTRIYNSIHHISIKHNFFPSRMPCLTLAFHRRPMCLGPFIVYLSSVSLAPEPGHRIPWRKRKKYHEGLQPQLSLFFIARIIFLLSRCSSAIFSLSWCWRVCVCVYCVAATYFTIAHHTAVDCHFSLTVCYWGRALDAADDDDVSTSFVSYYVANFFLLVLVCATPNMSKALPSPTTTHTHTEN